MTANIHTFRALHSATPEEWIAIAVEEADKAGAIADRLARLKALELAQQLSEQGKAINRAADRVCAELAKGEA